jgi:NitT/TauT family transport system ATP-binding protein
MVAERTAEPSAAVASGPGSSPDRGEPILNFIDIGKRFPNGTVALTDLNLAIQPGEFVSIVGPSGCGKSTLLRIASGLSPISSGRVETRFESLGYVFQDATLLPWRTVMRNVEFLAQLEGTPRDERRRRAQEAIDLVGLTGFERNYPKMLSGGMRMRVSLARALSMNPDPFLFDEPFGALDAITRERLNDEVLRLYSDRGFTGLFVTHSIQEAVYLSSRVVVMAPRPGRVIAEFPIPFDYPRSAHLRYTPEFGELAHEIAECLRGVSE